MSNYISLQGNIYLASIVNGVAGPARHVGNAPDFEVATDADILEHTESMTGSRTVDFTMTKTKKVTFKGSLEEVTPENIAYILNGNRTDLSGGAVTDFSLGTVAKGMTYALGGYNVSNVVLKDGSTTIDATKYTLDAVFGTVTFQDVTGITGAVKASFTSGKAVVTTINDTDSKEYQLTFRGINTVDKSHVELVLWRTKKDAKSTFPLIHAELGKYEINGSALSDTTKVNDATLGLFGRMVVIPSI